MRTNWLRGTALSLSLLAALAAGCGGGGGGDTQVVTPQADASPPWPQSDLEIATLLYADEARTPAGFYAEAPAPTTGYVTTSHLDNLDVVAGGTARHELCTDDWNQALEWSETAAQARAAYADLVATEANDRYFEFGRVPQGEPDVYVRDRVFRCAYLDRSGVDLSKPAGSAGRLNARPVAAGKLRELSEYLWLFTSFNNFGHAVLASRGEPGDTALAHTLYVASLTRASQPGGCDRIDVIEWRHRANAESGELELERRAVRSFGARELGAGVAELCAL